MSTTHNISNHWHSTKNPNGPSKQAEKGTFRDISLEFLAIGCVDAIDATCIKQGFSRSEYLQLAIQLAEAKPELLTNPQAHFGIEKS